MIQLQSRLTVADNSGARQVQCIRILSKGKSKTARPGDLITVAVKQARPHKKIQKKDVCVGIVVRTCKEVVRNNGFKLGFGDNACILVNSKTDKTPVGTRLSGPIAVRELRKAKAMKCILLSKQDM